ncbi:hypothetical protein BUZ85_13750 [Mammaliicoccus sciuri]|nr:hypothetical protein BUZ85_13750 [Mammaliicoccus sciuri]
MQNVAYQFIVLDFESNKEVYRYTSETKDDVKRVLKSLKDENGVTYKIIICGSIGFVGDVEEIPNDIEASVEVSKLKLPIE